MTEKLYYRKPELYEFTATILSISEKDNNYHIELDRTAFYPEGGGQPADKGIIAGQEVKNVYTKYDKVFHVVAEVPQQREYVSCEVNRAYRFDNTQQHTGQHLLSAIFDREYGAATCGFHLGEDYVSIDIDKELEVEEISRVEGLVNDKIYQNLDIDILYPEQEDLDEMELRKEPTVTENIRVVKIGSIDFSPCGGTHLNNTGELGLLKIIDFSNYKQGMRIKFLCGKRALADYGNKNSLIANLRDTLSVKSEDIIDKVIRQQEKISELEREIQKINDDLLDYKARDLIDNSDEIQGVRIIKKLFTEDSFQDVRFIAAKITEMDRSVVVFAQRDNTTARMILARSDDISNLNMAELIEEPLAFIDGNGGGNKLQAQGGGNNVDRLSGALKMAYEAIIKKLRGE